MQRRNRRLTLIIIFILRCVLHSRWVSVLFYRLNLLTDTGLFPGTGGSGMLVLKTQTVSRQLCSVYWTGRPVHLEDPVKPNDWWTLDNCRKHHIEKQNLHAEHHTCSCDGHQLTSSRYILNSTEVNIKVSVEETLLCARSYSQSIPLTAGDRHISEGRWSALFSVCRFWFREV